MWLLKVHVVFSILCFIAAWVVTDYKTETIRENGWMQNKIEKSGFLYLGVFLVPIINLLVVMFMFMTVYVKKSDFYKWLKEKLNDGKRF